MPRSTPLVKSDIIGAERLEERSLSALFAYQLQDRFRITAILQQELLHGQQKLTSLTLYQQ